MKRAALYLRVSTERQTTENQRVDLERMAKVRGFSPAGVVVYEETESAAKKRPVFEQMMTDARAGKVSAVMVWSLDRLHRSMVGAVSDVLELDRIGVAVLSVKDSWLDTSGPVRSLLVAIFGWVAEQERTRLIERTRAGIDRARREGKQLGRPRASPVLLGSAADRVKSGWSIRRAAKTLGVNESTLRRHIERQTHEGR